MNTCPHSKHNKKFLTICEYKRLKAQRLKQGLKSVFYSTAETTDTDGRTLEEWIEFIAEQGNEDAQELLKLQSESTYYGLAI